MRNIKIILGLLILLISCKSNHRNNFEYNLGANENQWINNFKTETFFSCLRVAYKNDTIFKLISKKDLMYLYESTALQHDIINKNVEKIIANTPKPVLPKCEECEPEEQINKKYFCATCLSYYASKELDSIAKIEFKKYNLK
ncbi:hypothetical protein [Flavobacterium xanthum]|uniref:Lipoprotein n=1 Tax=Flavobacterium xanthum TaxID=69322 RepID=A0A1M7GL14_9FLAO|nr:hypothetical protein [Flavobacterium xanthum]SHM16901.1 hypothetical protein SAMN05443669_102426 [Flavobacterium xanthum]